MYFFYSSRMDLLVFSIYLIFWFFFLFICPSYVLFFLIFAPDIFSFIFVLLSHSLFKIMVLVALHIHITQGKRTETIEMKKCHNILRIPWTAVVGTNESVSKELETIDIYQKTHASLLRPHNARESARENDYAREGKWKEKVYIDQLT